MFLHIGIGSAHSPINPQAGHVHGDPPLFPQDRRNVAASVESGVVAQDVDPAKLLLCECHRTLHISLAGAHPDKGADSLRVFISQLSATVKILLIYIHKEHLCPFVHKVLQRNGGNRRAAAHKDRHFIL